MDHAINAPGHGNIVVDGLNANEKHYLTEQMDLIGELESNDTSKIGMIPIASKYFTIKLTKQFLHIINNIDRLNGLKVSTKMQTL